MALTFILQWLAHPSPALERESEPPITLACNQHRPRAHTWGIGINPSWALSPKQGEKQAEN